MSGDTGANSVDPAAVRGSATAEPLPREVEGDGAAARREVIALQAALDALWAELDATNARWAALYRTAVMFTRRAFAADILEQIVRSCMELLQADQGILLEYSPITNDLVIRVALSARGEQPLPVGRRVKPGEGLTGLAWQTGRVQTVDEYRRWPGRLPDARVERTRAAVAVPLVSNRGTVGVLGMAFEQEGRRFSAQEIRTLELFAQQATAILDANAGQRLLQELAVRAERRRLAQRLHDGMQQRLAALLLKLDWCQSQLKEDQEPLYDGLNAIAGQIYELITELRSIASVLHETELSGRSIGEAVHLLVAQVTAETGLQIHLDTAGLHPRRLPTAIEAAALR
ncbi:MAG: GAF domain-containing protein, partial [Anaerolineae bacterium]